MGGWYERLNIFQKALVIVASPIVKLRDVITYQKNRKRGIWKWLKK